MKQVVIENPVINSPFEVPARHFRFDEDGITNQIVEGRRLSSYFVPIAPAFLEITDPRDAQKTIRKAMPAC